MATGPATDPQWTPRGPLPAPTPAGTRDLFLLDHKMGTALWGCGEPKSWEVLQNVTGRTKIR